MNRCIRVAASFLRKISWPAGLEVVGCSDQEVEPSAFEAEEVFGASLHFVPNVLGCRPPGRYGAAGGIQKQIGRGRYQTNIALYRAT